MVTSTLGALKVNIDAAVKRDSPHVGVGIIVRDNFGMIVAAVTRKITGFFSPFLAECIAVRDGLHFCVKLNLPIRTIETHARNVVKAILTPHELALESSIII
ncbi:Ribonuclease H-like domain containing protein [Trema orientale]|uniref:Ribonuclease H-like domain containing protein n=1 Tax=Trema orientale TaxID=63057 RepID=A0A2P5EED9_TREOI|nr:Ribonuclease H-like domain containing protein [Trema orientale]